MFARREALLFVLALAFGPVPRAVAQGPVDPPRVDPTSSSGDGTPPHSITADPSSGGSEAALRRLEERVAEQEKRNAEHQAIIASQAERIADLEKSAEASGTALEHVMTDVLAAAELKEPALRFYGYMDFGLQKLFVPEGSILQAVAPTDKTTFLLGNINLYLDAKPSDSWRSLLEIRFTNLPHGEDRAFRTPFGGAYERRDTTFLDLTRVGGRNREIGGAIVIERAQVDWLKSDRFNLRVGYFLTPYGIWNIDHGTPTLISLLMPEFILWEFFPDRQLGVMAFGTIPTGPWDLGYNVYLSNGRTPTEFDLSEDKAIGGRLTATRRGRVNFTAGGSAYVGTYQDVEKAITSFNPYVVAVNETVAYREYALGADLALDAGRFRFRTEAVMHRVVHEPGKFQPTTSGPPGSTLPDRYEYSGYVLGAYRLPFWNLEPYLMVNAQHGPFLTSDSAVVFAPGLNIYLSAETQLKMLVGIPRFFNLVNETPANPSQNNFTIFDARFVAVF